MNGVGSVSSSSYHAAGRNLLVSFSSGRIFVFSCVPPELAGQWRAVDDKTLFFEARISGYFKWLEISNGKLIHDLDSPDPFVRRHAA
ncbi:MAG: KTSC domain-containing protein [Dokdonella sp.]